MEKKFKDYRKAAVVILSCFLCACGTNQESINKRASEEPQVQASDTENIIEGIEEEKKEELTELASLQEAETEITTQEAEKVSSLEEKWKEYWSDGIFTFEETEQILQDAGYSKNADGFYIDINGELVDCGITYDFIQNGYVFMQRENGSYYLVSPLEAGLGEYDSDAVDDLIRSYGYEVEYNNDKAYVRDGYGEYYSYEKFASLLLHGGTIPYAPGKSDPKTNDLGGSDSGINDIEWLLGEWVSAKGKEIDISKQEGRIWLTCSSPSPNGSRILELEAEIQIDADGTFSGYYMEDGWGNQGSVYGEYQAETEWLSLIITVDVDSGLGWSLEMNEQCIRKYNLSFGEFVSMGADVSQLGYLWLLDGEDYYMDIRRDGDSAYVDLYNKDKSTSVLQLYQNNCKLKEDENGIYIKISDAYCDGKVYFNVCGDNKDLWIFAKMVLPYDEHNSQYYNSRYASYFNRTIYCLVERP